MVFAKAPEHLSACQINLRNKLLKYLEKLVFLKKEDVPKLWILKIYPPGFRAKGEEFYGGAFIEYEMRSDRKIIECSENLVVFNKSLVYHLQRGDDIEK